MNLKFTMKKPTFRMTPLLLITLFSLLTFSFSISPPKWPDQFNATLAKINPNNSNIQWTKFYYAWSPQPGGLARFDFKNTYYSYFHTWNTTCSILFSDYVIWFVDWNKQICKNDHPNMKIPSINPDWLSEAKFVGEEEFRGLAAWHWDLPTDLGDIQYFERVGTREPLRSTNQLNDVCFES